MYCVHCGNDVNENDKFCYYCGKKVIKNGRQPRRCWTAFAKVSYIIGIVSLCTWFIPFFNLGLYGILFSILGASSIEPRALFHCNKGRIMSIIGAALSSFFTTLTVVSVIVFIIVKYI